MVEGYKCMDVHLDNTKKCNTEAFYHEGQSRFYFLRRLRSLNVCSKIMHIFYKSAVENVICFAAICWDSSISASDLNKRNKLIKKADSVLETALGPQ